MFDLGTFDFLTFDVGAVPVIVPVTTDNAGTGGTGGGGHGGARWERASSSDVKPGALSVKAQNKKERLELEQIEREIARQEQITAKEPTESELNIVKGLLAEAKAESEKVTAMAAAFEAAEQARSEQFAREVLARDELAREQALLDEEEEDILILLATIH